MMHRNKLLQTIFSKYHANTRMVCFPVGRFVSMSSIYELMTKVCVIWVKLMKQECKQPLLTSQFDVSTLQKQLQSVMQIHLDQSNNFGPLPPNICVTVNHNTLFNSIIC